MRSVYWIEKRESDVRQQQDWLSTAEVAHLDNLRFEKRRNEWLLGRWTAKSAISACMKFRANPASFAQIEIRSSTSGAPQAFTASRRMDLEISLTHRSGRAACAVAELDTALGCDLELVEPRGNAFMEDYLVPSEQEIVARATPQARDWIVTLIWSAKESALKSLHTGLRLDTYSVVVTPELELQSAKILPENHDSRCALDDWRSLAVRSSHGANFSGWWRFDGKFVRTLTAIPQPSRPIPLRIDAYAETPLSISSN